MEMDKEQAERLIQVLQDIVRALAAIEHQLNGIMSRIH